MLSLQSPARLLANALGRDSRLVRRLQPWYERYLIWSHRGSGIPWPINGEVFRINPKYRPQLGQEYDPPVARYLRERVKAGQTCLDVGANVGVYVLQFARWSAPGGRIVAFEPNPAARAVLEEHIRLNGFAGRAEVVGAAIGAAEGDATLFAADADGMSRLGAPSSALTDRIREVKVPVVTLDSFCRQRNLRPDWLMIDVEGFEFAALAGARRILRERRGEMGVVAEMHPGLWASAQATRASAEAFLSEMNLKAEPLTGQKDPLGEHGTVVLKNI